MINNRIEQTSVLGFIIFGLFGRSLPFKSQFESPEPNIIIIFTDYHNNNQTGCYGGINATPNMDQLAKEGIRFTRYYPCTSLCSPSRYSILTGRYPSNCKTYLDEFSSDDPVFIRWNTDIVEGEMTIAHLMKEHGYVTGLTGKWHNLDWSTKNKTLRHLPDLDDPESPVIKQVIENNYKQIKEQIKKTSGFDSVEAVYGTNFNWLPITEKLMYHNQHWITYNSLKFIEQNKDRPFFHYMAITLPHGLYPLKSLRADPRATPVCFLTEHMDCQPSYGNILERAGEAGIKNDAGLSEWATMASLDDGVGAIVQKLDELRLRENTLIILASDNDSPGKIPCNHRPIPFIANWKKQIEGGQVCDELVSNVDVLPIVLDACGIVNENAKIDGQSLRPLFHGSTVNWRKSLYLEVTYTRGVVTNDYKYVAIRFFEENSGTGQRFDPERIYTGRRSYKIRNPVRYNSDKRYPGYFDADQLYDLNTDSLEQNNLAQNSDFEKPL